MASSKASWPSSRIQAPRRSQNTYAVATPSVQEKEMEMLRKQVAELKAKVEEPIANVSKIQEKCELCHGPHYTNVCHLLEEQPETQPLENANYVGQQQQQQQQPRKGYRDPYSDTYNPGWRDHPNLRYGPASPNFTGGANQGQGSSSNQPPQGNRPYQGNFYQPNQGPYRHPNYQGQAGGRQPYQGNNQHQNQQATQPQNKTSEGSTDERLQKLESMFEKFMATQMEFNNEQRKAIQEQKNVNQQFHAAIRNVENSISQLAKDRPRESGKLPSNPDPNPRNQCHAIEDVAGSSKGTERCEAITLRNQKVVDLQVGKEQKKGKAVVDEEELEKKKVDTEESKENKSESNVNTQEREKQEEREKQKAALPYPKRFHKANEDKAYAKFLEMLKRI